MQSHGQEFPLTVESNLYFADIVPAMLIGQEHFGSLATPLDWPIQLSCRPQRQTMFDVLPTLCAKATSNIVAYHRHTAFRDLENGSGEDFPNTVWIVDICMQRIAVFVAVV